MAAIPNALTVLRIVIAAAFPILPESWRLWAVLVAGASDAVDGWLARRLGATGPAGALLDGVADKALGVAVLGTLAWDGVLALWQLAVLLSRDLAVGLIAAYVAARREWWAFGRMSARFLGKATTVAAFAMVVVMLAWPGAAAAAWLMWGTMALSVGAGVDYVGVLVRGVRETPGGR